MILCLRLCLRASRSFSSLSSTSSSAVSLSNLRFLFRFSTLLHQSPSEDIESYLANLILTTHEHNRNPNWSSDRFRLLLTTPDLLIRVLKMIREKPEIAFHAFKWLQRQDNVKQYLKAFATMLEILAENDLMKKAYWVAERSIDLGMHELTDLLIHGDFDKKDCSQDSGSLAVCFLGEELHGTDRFLSKPRKIRNCQRGKEEIDKR